MDLQGLTFVVGVLAVGVFALSMGVLIAALCRAASDLPEAPIKGVTVVQCEECHAYRPLYELRWQEPQGFVCKAHQTPQEVL